MCTRCGWYFVKNGEKKMRLQKWNDPRLKWAQKDYSGLMKLNVLRDSIWFPNVMPLEMLVIMFMHSFDWLRQSSAPHIANAHARAQIDASGDVSEIFRIFIHSRR